MTAPSKNKTHLLIGLIDQTKYKKHFFHSNFWKELPNSFCWDVWGKLIYKSDQSGRCITTKKDYGCDYEDYETKLGVEYDQENRTIRFYKNDIKFDIAFHNVPPNLTPVLDVFFESGTIEITGSTNPEEKIFL